MSIEVVVGHPHSDIGKGWIASGIGAHMEKPLIIKIDPMLNEEFPPELGVAVGGKFVTDDAHSYIQRGLAFNPEHNVVMGGFLAHALQKNAITEGILGKEIPKLTYADISVHLAEYIHTCMEEAGTNNAIIEIGGCSDDQEAGVIPGAMRLLDGIYPVGIHIVTKFDFTDNQGILDVKTRSAVRAIEETMRRYWNLPLRTAYIRRYHVPESIPDDVLETACKKIAFKTQINPKRIVYVPNVEHQEDLDAYIAPGLQE